MSIARRLPAFAINGLTVAAGIGLIQLLVAAVAGPHAALLALSGAICTSLADMPVPAVRTWHRVSAAGVLSVAAALAMALLKPHPAWLGPGIAAITFVAMMTMAWGVRAGAVSFAPILAVVFSLASPAGADPVLPVVAWNAAGSAAYLGWSLLCARALARPYQRLALAEALRATVQLLQARADLIATPAAAPEARAAMRAWVLGEAALADRVQAARDFVFADPTPTSRPAAMLLRAIDLRDLLLASRLDLELLGDDAGSRWLLAQTAQALRHLGARLDAVDRALRGRAPPAGAAEAAEAATAAAGFDYAALYAQAPIAADDPRSRLLPALVMRLRAMDAVVDRIATLQQGASEALPLQPAELQRFVAPEGWPLRALWSQLHLASPVARHALRAALALGSAYVIGRHLPWASHPHWLVLSVAVVLRGNLEQTLSRRNARVGGTLLGCALVLALAGLHTPALLAGVFLLAVGTAHAFVLQRYWVSAGAATVMALLQVHAVNPALGFPVAERAADTLLGALLAWGFSYVLPSWERRQLPSAVEAALKALDDYAAHALRWPAAEGVQPRMARRRAYDALSALAATLQRSRAEPRGVQLPVAQVAAMIDHGQRLMAHLSMVRMILAGSGVGLEPAATLQALQRAQAALRECLQLPPAAPAAPPLAVAPPGPDDPAAPPAGPDDLAVLPAEAPSEDLMPWLQRRLQGLQRDARLVRSAAATALAQVRPPAAAPGG
ncbi:MAG: FUSC family protein [Burkholderiales bacterium]|nr:FUSC family protein [Burkholderiales bacterium]